MNQQAFTRPFYIFLLVIPAGISIGFVSVALPYFLTHNGFSVAAASGIVALGVSANLWRFLWGPVADLSLTLKKWYWIGIVASTSTLLLLCFTPLTVKGTFLLSVIVFVSQVGATLVLLPIGSFMANRIEESQKGRAAGWYQAGNLGGMGFGGGAGLWLTTHYNIQIAGMILCLLSVVFALTVIKIKDVKNVKTTDLKSEIADLGRSLLSMVRIPAALLVVILICLPISTGALGNVWAAIAADWHTDADTVALVTGILSGLASALACIAGGYIADKYSKWFAYIFSGLVCTAVTVTMAFCPMVPYIYVAGVLLYAVAMGLNYAAFSAVLLYAIGKKKAATKYSLLSSLGNIPVVYMTAIDGWSHDAFNSRNMLLIEGLLCIIFVVLFAVALKWYKSKNWLVASID